ncbi:MAG: hypothetical protein WAO58_07245 [Fimbriimonadaceae bacterium]
MDLEPIAIARVLVCTFFAVLFIQSGVDKVVDRAGNLAWLEPHFGKSPLKGAVPLMLGVITILELAAGVLSAAGAVVLVVGGPGWVPTAGVGLSALAILCLFAGQRIAKDYAGAAVLAAYFAVALLGLMIVPVSVR